MVKNTEVSTSRPSDPDLLIAKYFLINSSVYFKRAGMKRDNQNRGLETEAADGLKRVLISKRITMIGVAAKSANSSNHFLGV